MSDHQLDAMRFVLIPQKKRHSFAEAALGTFIGFFVALIVGFLIYPHLDMHAHTGIVTATSVFTVLSVVRSYYVRRFFNWLHEREIL
ncbi:MAG: hypothetical protein CTY35_03565 [Methylotenera sp.]|nr:MAG: hypothetical protein CTY35_03565 [Methylotenera sp.]